jgi:hypothetical protein
MISIRRGTERGRSEHGWLNSYHTFSFADYYDPAHMGFGDLRVINEDRVQPGKGFPPHSHRDMEIISYVLEGALRHKDSLGNGSVIRPGEVQRLTAGTGMTHSEYNHSPTEPVHFLQIWILPERRGLQPGYEQRAFAAAERQGELRLLASREGGDGSVKIHQDANVYAGLLAKGEEIAHQRDPARHAWLHVVRGAVTLNGIALEAGDGAAVTEERTLALRATAAGEVLLFELR